MNCNFLDTKITNLFPKRVNANGLKNSSNPRGLMNSIKSSEFVMRIFMVGMCVCLLDAQIIYDNPPIGVSLTRPILPWLARYFVNAGNSKVYFLDDPQRGPLEKKEGGGKGEVGGKGDDNEAAFAPVRVGGGDKSNGNGEGVQKMSPTIQFKPFKLNDQQKARLDQLRYMVPVPVPVLPASLFSSAVFASPISPPMNPPLMSPLPTAPILPPPEQFFPVPAPTPIAIGQFPGIPSSRKMPSAPPPSFPNPLPPMPLPIPIAASFIAAPPAPFITPPEPFPIMADSIPAPIPVLADPMLMSPPQPPPPPPSIPPSQSIPAAPAPIAPFPQTSPPIPGPLPIIAPTSLLMSGSPASSDANSKFSYRDAVLKGAHAPAPAQPPSKTARVMLTTVMRRFSAG